MVKVFTKNKNGKIEFTEEELKKVLDEAFWEGYNMPRSYIWSSPYSFGREYYNWCSTSTSVTLNSPDMESDDYTINTVTSM